MPEAVEGDLLAKLKALHRDRQIRISQITDNGWFPMRDEAIDVLFAALSRAEAEREERAEALAMFSVEEIARRMCLKTDADPDGLASHDGGPFIRAWEHFKADALRLSRTSGSST